MSLNKTSYPLLCTGLPQEDPSLHDQKYGDRGVKNQNKQTITLLLKYLDNNISPVMNV